MLTDINADIVHELRTMKRETASRQTVNRNMALLRAILKQCVEIWEWLPRAPKIPMYSIPKSEPRWLTREEWSALEAELPADKRRAANFALATGLRAGAIRTLRWSDIDGNIARVRIASSKNAEPLRIPLNKTALAVLDECRGMHPDLVFVTDDGRPLRRELANKAWRAAVERAGIEYFRFHDLRHTWASWHVQNGTPLEVLRELGGWKSFRMVLVYAHLAPETRQQWAENVA